MNSLASLIVIEGIDGSGKGTQSARLLERATAEGYRAALFSFPRYQQTFFGQRIGEFLNGDFGSLQECHPFLISLLYAGDRFESRSELTAAREQNDLLILDRYVPSNIAHQTAKVPVAGRKQLREWIEHIEYEIYELPRPDRVFFLEASVSGSQELISRKQKRCYTDQKADLQESDTDYLQQVRQVYLELCETQSGWSSVPVMNETDFRPIGEINEEIWQQTLPLFAAD